MIVSSSVRVSVIERSKRKKMTRDIPDSMKPMTQTRTKRKKEKAATVKTLEKLKFEPLEITWLFDYDILSVHKQVMEYLRSKYDRRDAILRTIKHYKTFSSSIGTSDYMIDTSVKIEELRKQLDTLDTVSIMDYMVETANLLSEYKNLSSSVKVFGSNKEVGLEQLPLKSKIVKEYFKVASSYCPMNVKRNVVYGILCEICASVIEDTGGGFTCTECGTAHRKIDTPPETTEISPSKRQRVYQNGGNFRDIVLQFQGTYPITIPERVYKKIISVTENYRGFDIKTLSKPDLYRIMKGAGMGAWYKHINAIHYYLTGIPPPDIKLYERKLLARIEIFNSIYNEIKPADRVNSMHGLYMLWLFLKNEGYEPKKSDFIALKGRDVEIGNLEILKKGFKILNKTHPEYKWQIYEIP